MRAVTGQDFVDQVLRMSHDRPVAVMFTAPWCGPCKVMKPIVERVAAERGFDYVFAACAGLDRDLAVTWGVRSVPTLMIFEKGAPTRRASISTEKQIHDLLASGTLGWVPFQNDGAAQ